MKLIGIFGIWERGRITLKSSQRVRLCWCLIKRDVRKLVFKNYAIYITPNYHHTHTHTLEKINTMIKEFLIERKVKLA